MSGSDLFIVDNSDNDWKVLRYLRDFCEISEKIDIATGYFEIGALLSLQDEICFETLSIWKNSIK